MLRPSPEGTRSELPNAPYRHIRGRVHDDPLADRVRRARASREQQRGEPDQGDDITVGVLMPEKANTRYEEFDYPIIKEKVAALTNKQGKAVYANGGANAKKQVEPDAADDRRPGRRHPAGRRRRARPSRTR